MKAVVQRVSEASVTVDDQIIGSIGQGLLVYIGIHATDDMSKIEKMATKLLQLRIFEDTQGKMNLSVKDVQGALMLISQFTLYGDASKGNRPSFIEAARPEQAELLYQALITRLAKDIEVASGQFQAHMAIHSINDGPVTIIHEL